MTELVWTKPARADILSIVDYVSDDSPAAAQRIKDDIEKKARRLVDFPNMGRSGRVEGTRELVVCANYLLVYQAMREGSSTVRILRVLHAAQQWPTRTSRPRYKLSERLEMCDKTAPMPEELQVWDKDHPIGEEAL